MTGPSSLYVQLPILAAVATAAICATALQARQLPRSREEKGSSITVNSDDQSHGCNEVKYVTIGTVATEMSLDDDDDKTSNEDDIQSEWTASPRSVQSTDLVNGSAMLKSTVEDDVSTSEPGTILEKSNPIHSKRYSRFPVVVMMLLVVLACSVQVVLNNTSLISKQPFIINIIHTTPLCNDEFYDWVDKKSYGRIDIRNMMETTTVCQTKKNINDDPITSRGKTTTNSGGTKRFIRQILGGVQLSMDE